VPAALPPTATPDPAQLPAGQRARRDRIVTAALDLLLRSEYDAVQMREVAEEAGVALATLYRYFTSKEHLYAAVVLEWAADYPRPARALPGDAESRIRLLMRRAVRAFERHPQVIRVEMVLESSHDPNARALFEEFGRRNTAALVDALGSLDPDDAAAIVETVHSVLVTRLRSWALGRATIADVDRSVQRALDLVFSPAPTS
jgi:AcrR family transcriptional regulator